MTQPLSNLRRLLAALLVISAIVFTIGASIERSSHHETIGHTEPENAAGTHAASGEGSGEGSGVGSGEGSGSEQPSAPSTESTSSETLFGINPESVALVSVAVVASVMLALGVWVLPRRWPLVLAAIFGLAFAALDIREAIHQIHESRTSLVVLAFVLMALHLAISAVTGFGLQRSEPAPVAA